MGLFTPKINPRELEYVRTRMQQLQDSVNLVNTSTKPDVFFRRLNFSLDILLDLQNYERYGIFKGSMPTDDYNAMIRDMEATVNAFIDRADEANRKKVASLKTENAKQNNRKRFAESLIAAFNCANTFWSGNYSSTRIIPHYTGQLFTENNYRCVQKIYDDAHNSEGLTQQLEKNIQKEGKKMFCRNCGAQIDDKAVICVHCGVATRDEPKQVYPQQQPTINIVNNNTNTNVNRAGGYVYIRKRKWLAFILCLLFGYFGAHRFYVGKSGTGLLWLFTFGLFGIGWILDLISIFIGGFRDKLGQPLA